MNGRCASPSTARTAHGPDHMPLAHSARHPELPHLVSAKHTHVSEDATLIAVLLDYHSSSINSTLAYHANPVSQNKENGLDTMRQRKQLYTVGVRAMSAPLSGYSKHHDT